MMTNEKSASYRPKGELEVNSIEPLPPTEITPKAIEILMEWGFTEEQILSLREFTAAFRYDRVLEKVKRLSQFNAVLTTENDDSDEDDEENNNNGNEDNEDDDNVDRDQNDLYVKIPHFYDIQGRLDGQCGDIGRNFIALAEYSGLIEDLNTEVNFIREGWKVATCFSTGKSKTHFCTENSNHVWNGIALLNKRGQLVESILIDAAFQNICTEDESGYQRESRIIGPTGAVGVDDSISVELGWVEIQGDAWKASTDSTAVLGVSDNRKYAYSLGFARQIPLDESPKDQKDIILPILNRIQENGLSQVFMINPQTNKLLKNSPSLLYVLLTRDEEIEIRNILEEASKINILQGTEAGQAQKTRRYKALWH